jgi:hypothetical protein
MKWHWLQLFVEQNLLQEGGNEIKEKGKWNEEKEEEMRRETGERNRGTCWVWPWCSNDSVYKKSTYHMEVVLIKARMIVTIQEITPKWDFWFCFIITDKARTKGNT